MFSLYLLRLEKPDWLTTPSASRYGRHLVKKNWNKMQWANRSWTVTTSHSSWRTIASFDRKTAADCWCVSTVQIITGGLGRWPTRVILLTIIAHHRCTVTKTQTTKPVRVTEFLSCSNVIRIPYNISLRWMATDWPAFVILITLYCSSLVYSSADVNSFNIEIQNIIQ